MRDQITFSQPSERFAIPLAEAWYCESCHVILNVPACFCCASAVHSYRLAQWLDREPIRIPLSGVFLSVTPPRKGPAAVQCVPLQKRAPRAS